MFKLCFFVPVDSAEQVKLAVFGAGAGRIGNYDRCCWQVKGQGQFRPLAGSDPHIGQHGEVELVEELKIEMVCDAKHIQDAVAALRQVHPYEEVAYEVYKLQEM